MSRGIAIDFGVDFAIDLGVDFGVHFGVEFPYITPPFYCVFGEGGDVRFKNHFTYDSVVSLYLKMF